MKCDNVEKSCQWKGTVGTLEKHMGVCQFSSVPCPKKCRQGNFITKRNLQQHFKTQCPNRDYSCEHCDLKGTYATTLDHYATCEKKIVTCMNEKCTMEMERMKIKNHLSEECEHTVISCKYMSIGCDVKLKRKDMKAHEQDDKVHFAKTVDTVVKLRGKMAKLQEETTKLTKENNDRFEAELEDKVARAQFTMQKEMAESLIDKKGKLNKLNEEIEMNKTSLNRMKYILTAVAILFVVVGADRLRGHLMCKLYSASD